jgi:sodium/potassium/calcium exchanger 6
MVFCFFSFAMSIIWIWMTANLLIDLFDLFGIVTKIPPTLLGLTILAWGNSVGDLTTDLSIAKKGFGEMAITGCYAGPLFNTLFGFGITTLKANFE